MNCLRWLLKYEVRTVEWAQGRSPTPRQARLHTARAHRPDRAATSGDRLACPDDIDTSNAAGPDAPEQEQGQSNSSIGSLPIAVSPVPVGLQPTAAGRPQQGQIFPMMHSLMVELPVPGDTATGPTALPSPWFERAGHCLSEANPRSVRRQRSWPSSSEQGSWMVGVGPQR